MIGTQIIILAAGNGSRMQSELPKVLHKVGDIPMLEIVLNNAIAVTSDVIVVYSERLQKYLLPYQDMCQFSLQKEPLGTAHATYCALDIIDANKTVLVLYGDHPLITPGLMHELVDHLVATQSALVTLSFKRDDPAQYGRIITDQSGNFLGIVEHKYANDEEKKIKLCNSGVMAFKPGVLNEYLPRFAKNSIIRGQEIYLTEIVEICRNDGEKVSYLLSEKSNLIVGVNTQEELSVANNIFSRIDNYS